MESVEVNDLEKVKCRISGEVFKSLTANFSLRKRDLCPLNTNTMLHTVNPKTLEHMTYGVS